MSCNNRYDEIVSSFRAYVSPIIFLFGLIGNICVVWTFSSRALFNRFATYSISLAVCHSVILISNTFLDDFLGRGLSFAVHGSCSDYIVKLDIMSSSACKAMQYIPETMYFTSSWILVAFSLDRLLTITHPMKFYSSLYHKHSMVLCSCIGLVGLLITTPIPVSSGLILTVVSNNTRKKCDILTNSQPLTAATGLYIKVVASFIIPTMLILLLNAGITSKLIQLKYKRTSLLSNDCHRNGLEMSRVIGHLGISSAILLLSLPLAIGMILRLQYTSSSHLKDLSRLFSSIRDFSYACNFYVYIICLYSFKWHFLERFTNFLLLFPCLRSNKVIIQFKIQKISSKIKSYSKYVNNISITKTQVNHGFVNEK